MENEAGKMEPRVEGGTKILLFYEIFSMIYAYICTRRMRDTQSHRKLKDFFVSGVPCCMLKIREIKNSVLNLQFPPGWVAAECGLRERLEKRKQKQRVLWGKNALCASSGGGRHCWVCVLRLCYRFVGFLTMQFCLIPLETPGSLILSCAALVSSFFCFTSRIPIISLQLGSP